MINDLKRVINNLPQLMKNRDKWSSQFITYSNPCAYRLYRQWGKLTINFHKFVSTNSKVVWHPHPYPSAFIISKGCYELYIGHSETDPQPAGPIIMGPSSFYQMTSEHDWHSVRPLEITYTICIDGPRFNVDWEFESEDRDAFGPVNYKEKNKIWSHFSSNLTRKKLKKAIGKYKSNKKGMYSFF